MLQKAFYSHEFRDFARRNIQRWGEIIEDWVCIKQDMIRTSTWILEHLQIYLHIRWFLGQTFWCYTVHQWSQRAVRQLTLYLTFSTSSRTFGGSGAWPLLILTTSRWLCLSEVYFTKFFFRGNLGGF